uniref:Uncharacterized protein n=1 Tax=Alexandrium monilatum TaxID=311494 RepID=A0A7S4Q879_9DINO|mmetsp:Transcript_88113/g.278709  ORF Transcript_88113/g.278709 Transcript_88113/m.278709 type:complete len:118 (-) Transcript_88113:87-440(-)
MSSILATKEGQSPIQVKMPDGTTEDVHVDWNLGPIRSQPYSGVKVYYWNYATVKDHWTNYEKEWSAMSTTEKECAIYTTAKINKVLRERNMPKPPPSSGPKKGRGHRVGGALIRISA